MQREQSGLRDGTPLQQCAGALCVTAPINGYTDASANYVAFNNGQFTQANVSSLKVMGVPVTSAADDIFSMLGQDSLNQQAVNALNSNPALVGLFNVPTTVFGECAKQHK